LYFFVFLFSLMNLRFGFEIARKTKPNRDETDRAHELRFELAARGESAGLELNVFGFAAIPPIEHRWP
jgi:hypothetical protein